MQSSVTIENGWALYAHPFFVQRLTDLLEEVKRLAVKDPHGFHRHPHYEFFDAVTNNILVTVPSDPAHKNYLIGGTLGRTHQHWRRVKKQGLPNRYRLFFLFRSTAPKTIIYAWLNDETCIRREGDRRDVYKVFQRMLESGRIPSGFTELLAASEGLTMSAATGSDEETL